MDPDRTAPYADMEQIDLGPHCLLQKLLEYISRRQDRRLEWPMTINMFSVKHKAPNLKTEHFQNDNKFLTFTILNPAT